MRAATHKILHKTERNKVNSQKFHDYHNTAYCVGVIKQYCPHIDKHLVVFDGKLQTQWLTCEKGKVELLLTASAKSNEEEITEKETVAETSDLKELEKDGEGMDLSDDVEHREEQEQQEEAEGANESQLQLASSEVDSNCLLCDLPFALKDSKMRCNTCGTTYHDYCMPRGLLKPYNSLKDKNSKSQCWRCTSKHPIRVLQLVLLMELF